MSAWLSPDKLSKAIQIFDEEDDNITKEFPDWAAYLIWLGWWLRREIIDDMRLFLVVLLPTRECSSHFCCLGSLLGSIGKRHINLNWNDILSLPSGTEVYMRFPQCKGKSGNALIKAKLLDKIVINKQITRIVHIDTEKKRFKKSKIPMGFLS